MPWYLWAIVIGLGGFVLASGIGFAILRATSHGRRFLHLSGKGKLRVARALLRDPDVPLTAKGAVILVVLYLAMPIDLIPDFIPVLGIVDDVAIVVGVLALVLGLVPRERFEAALTLAEGMEHRSAQEGQVEDEGKPVSPGQGRGVRS